jgi:hypothetical protein
VILYILLSGIPPFGKRRGETDRDVKRNILRGAYRFYESHWKGVSPLAQELVSKLIVVNPADRLSWEQALEHPWIQGNAPKVPFGGEYIVELGQFNARRGMYKLASHALAGLVSRFAQPDAIAAISADTSSLSRLESHLYTCLFFGAMEVCFGNVFLFVSCAFTCGGVCVCVHTVLLLVCVYVCIIYVHSEPCLVPFLVCTQECTCFFCCTLTCIHTIYVYIYIYIIHIMRIIYIYIYIYIYIHMNKYKEASKRGYTT